MMKDNSGVLSISYWTVRIGTVRIGTIVLNEFGEMMKIELKMLGVVIALVSCVLLGQEVRAQAEKEDGYTSLFNGKDLDHWVIPEGDFGHWKVLLHQQCQCR